MNEEFENEFENTSEEQKTLGGDNEAADEKTEATEGIADGDEEEMGEQPCDDNDSSKKGKKSWKMELLEWIQSLCIAALAAILIVNFVFNMVRVDGQSMEPSLQHNDYLFVWQLGYNPDHGDIVIFNPVGDPEKYYVKRVIATEGQTVDIKNGGVYVDGELLEEDYIQGTTQNIFGAEFPQTVPEDCVFVLGDNREHSRDSRDPTGVGMVKKDTVKGRALFRLLPLKNIGTLPE